MILKFEKWVNSNDVNSQASDLFSESVICYKVGAYSAAYIMAFLGFQISIKDRMLKSNGFKPDNMDQRYYDNILKNLGDENKWDQQVFDAITRKSPDQIFLINDDIVTEYRYLKKIRNDCAHAKHNKIISSHVEILWSFIEVNYYKFVFNGGKASLLDKVQRHLDIRYTAPNTSWDSIVGIITASIETCEIKSFFQDVYKIFEDNFSLENVFKEKTKCNEFWKNILYSADGNLKEKFIEFLKDEKDVFVDFVSAFPDQVYSFYTDIEFMRIFWNDWLWHIARYNSKLATNLACQLIENNIVPSDEISGFIRDISRKLPNVRESRMLTLLLKYGYGDCLKSRIFNPDNYAAPNGIYYANNHWYEIKYYITLIGLDVDIVKVLNSMYNLTSYGEFHEGVTKLFNEDHCFTEKYKEIIIENQLKLPNILKLEDDQEVEECSL